MEITPGFLEIEHCFEDWMTTGLSLPAAPAAAPPPAPAAAAAAAISLLAWFITPRCLSWIGIQF